MFSRCKALPKMFSDSDDTVFEVLIESNLCLPASPYPSPGCPPVSGIRGLSLPKHPMNAHWPLLHSCYADFWASGPAGRAALAGLLGVKPVPQGVQTLAVQLWRLCCLFVSTPITVILVFKVWSGCPWGVFRDLKAQNYLYDNTKTLASCAVGFSRACMRSGISKDSVQKQIRKPRCLLLSQAL